MPLELPKLDDKDYDSLVDEARAALPGAYPGWTDHNPSDPGITLIELFAWLSDMFIYRTGQTTAREVRTHLRILNGGASPEDANTAIDDLLRSTLRAARERYRAVTPEDYEYLTTYVFPSSPEAATIGAVGGISRSRCLPERDLSGTHPTEVAPAHTSVIVVPAQLAGATTWEPLGGPLTDALGLFFRDRRLITTRVHVVGPTYVPITVTARIYLLDDALPADARASDIETVAARLRHVVADLFDPRSGGAERRGWPFGREAHVSEVYAALDHARGVDFVKNVSLSAQPQPRVVTEGGVGVAVTLAPHELPRVEATKAAVSLELWERIGGNWVKING